MRVAIQPNIGCGICDRCVSGNFHLCNEYRAFGINLDGAFAEHVKIPADAVLRGNLMLLPDEVTAEEAALTEPLSCAYNGFTKCFVKPGEYALVVGAGPIGVSHAMLLHMAGALVLMNDLSQERLDLSKKIMPYIETYSGNDLEGFVKEWTHGRGLDIAITACPVPQVQSAVLPLMNYGGRVEFFGGIPADKQRPYRHEYSTLQGTVPDRIDQVSIAQFRKTLEFVSQGLINVKAMITDRYELKDIKTAFENVRTAKGIKHIIRF